MVDCHRFEIVLPFVIVVAFIGCATPSPIVRLTPSVADIIWVGGRASVQKENAGVRVATAFEHQDGGTLGLRVEIENRTADRLELDPREITFTDCFGEGVDSCAGSRRIIDPEQVLAALDETQSRDRAAAANSQAFVGTMVLLSAVGDLATIASGHADRTTGLQTAATANLMEGDAASRNSALATIGVQRQIWSNQALRRNTLYPGQGVAGQVYVPIDLRARYVWLHVRTGERQFSFRFQQSVTQLSFPEAQPRKH